MESAVPAALALFKGLPGQAISAKQTLL